MYVKYISAQIKVGQRFDRLTVLRGPILKRRRTTYWCRCDCGTEREFIAGNLLFHHSRSCGCLCVDTTRERATIHGMTDSRLHNVWSQMKARCNSPGARNYDDYGGRGITVCQEWQDDFVPFMTWAMANGYSDKLQLDRKKNDQGYSPDNCRFVTQSRNCRNRRSNAMVTAFGETKCLADWHDDPRCKTTPVLIQARIKDLGWAPERAITTPKWKGGPR